MSIAERSTQTQWEGPLASGQGMLSQGSSAALDGLPLTWASRTEQPGGKTSPEELAAAAHSSCFAMALALKLGENHTPPQRLDVTATVILDAVDGIPTITTSRLKVRAQVAGLDDEAFATVVGQAAALCPVSRLFAGATISVDAELDESESARSAG
ncbi:OsmC family peroxiredoxin [Mycobacterium mantenii]|uniref:Osmotically inducible protein OsmC n=1 Tax=Mycobacterium mantenii TaxID=560555 RepID=A0A1A2T229_MYCNT|nr:OsmC family peroxiredoxin [Mycobacterium mantenii]OBH43420.1 osmotically inducible protein OsmC [Mycobacterium mantenii]OBH57647.1 osmotically inducible protein OsmC [Mycobacterium mantenii]OBH70445.1 osmotically inducible protein OsmC [Mycobacterium mantenii]